MNGNASVVLYAGCAVISAAWAVLVLAVGRGAAARPPALAGAMVAVWAATVAMTPENPLDGVAGLAEVLRSATWFAVLLLLCNRMSASGGGALLRGLGALGLGASLLAVASLLPVVGEAAGARSFATTLALARPALALLVVVVAENLYRNAPEEARWHVVLPCIALGGLAAFDLLLYADAALSGAFSDVLIDSRAVLAVLAVPLLAIAAMRDRRASREPPVSRQLVFHGATLLTAGTFLLGAGIVGEALHRLGGPWARAAQVGLLAGAVMALAVAVSARSVRSRLRRLVVDPFFRDRYDYRREWLRCVATLSAPDAEASAEVRAIRAIADAADSPAGILLLRDPGDPPSGAPALCWAGSWNGPATPLALPAGHAIALALRDGTWVAQPEPGEFPDLRSCFGPIWLAVPLTHHREGLLGVVLLSPPRAPFVPDSEVFALLRALGREVAMFLAERRAAQRVADAERIQAYAGRFAFVAHDVKTVATQLNLLLANAEANIADPEFQRDMLLTVGAAAKRIDTLIARLRAPEEGHAPSTARIRPVARLRQLAGHRPGTILLEAGDEEEVQVAMAPDAFDAAVTHLLDNAVEASPPGRPVLIRLRRQQGTLLVDIVDRGTGMSAAFLRDVLFRPLASSRPNGNGIGAWQARELLRRAGGDLVAQSTPGSGTTMRISLPMEDPLPMISTPAREPAGAGAELCP
ncbi:XrtA/PEP-CTERM system histidine kinase PrsK [Roseomonas populi]|uniref:histidine kinase n=1 Tax=Roseomonas populi TaxID=3121582 RepID=A0ABT1XAH7_9PROT|nr:XrtA/PEP-CTERM system histidine kinase PrsK [Roseomonas pecuniae]MCR0985105.1 PEP-CTERM system histidine kinase PrsK [Roseomonas pecuniae]